MLTRTPERTPRRGDRLRSQVRTAPHATKRLTLGVTQENQDALHVAARRYGDTLPGYLLRCHRIEAKISELLRHRPGSRLLIESPDGTRTEFVIV